MKFGLFGINAGPNADPQVAIEVARRAEAAGLESLWTAEHVVLPDPKSPPSPFPPEIPLLDPAVSLAFVAAATTTIRLGTGIIILPQRNPVVLAKELASVDVVSNGRLIFGVGIGYLKQEFDALGISFEDKGARTIDYLGAIRALWTMDQPEYRGRFANFAAINAYPRPVQRPHPPIVMGGHKPPAFRRAIEHANGWYGFAMTLADTQRCLAGLRDAAARYQRPAELGPLEISVSPATKIDKAEVAVLADLGVHRIIVTRWLTTAAESLQLVDDIAELL
ncbi:MAG TPA: LLM class F420-dependent oxidoreductase [Terriglobales bacterium]|nr:LLM class F420-dependent oxidoreductase [Terriglobales bacterium]